MRRIQRAFTLLEILVVVIILIILVGIALPLYQRSLHRAQSTEALTNLDSIRQAEFLHRVQHDKFVEAIDLPDINETLNLELAARYFDYEIPEATDNSFLIVASNPQVSITMDHAGQITYHWPSPQTGNPLSPGNTSGTVGAPGGNSGSSAGWGSSVSGGSGGGGGSSGSGGGGGGGGSSGAGSGVVPPGNTGPPGGIENPPPPDPIIDEPPSKEVSSGGEGRIFAYIPRGKDVWTNWPDSPLMNITGASGIQTLQNTFLAVASSGAKAVTEDIIRKGIPVSFGSTSDFTGSTENAIAFFDPSPDDTLALPPGPPDLSPLIKFNPDALNEAPGVLAAVLVHEGTHFQQYLDATLYDEDQTIVDIEFRAWWNEAVYWKEVRGQFLPIDTPLEEEIEFGYQTALQGEAALRDLIAALYT